MNTPNSHRFPTIDAVRTTLEESKRNLLRTFPVGTPVENLIFSDLRFSIFGITNLPRKIFSVRFHRRNFQLWFLCRDPEFVLATSSFEWTTFLRREKRIKWKGERRKGKSMRFLIVEQQQKILFCIRNRFFFHFSCFSVVPLWHFWDTNWNMKFFLVSLDADWMWNEHRFHFLLKTKLKQNAN